jgi:hypothetical protein
MENRTKVLSILAIFILSIFMPAMSMAKGRVIYNTTLTTFNTPLTLGSGNITLNLSNSHLTPSNSLSSGCGSPGFVGPCQFYASVNITLTPMYFSLSGGGQVLGKEAGFTAKEFGGVPPYNFQWYQTNSITTDVTCNAAPYSMLGPFFYQSETQTSASGQNTTPFFEQFTSSSNRTVCVIGSDSTGNVYYTRASVSITVPNTPATTTTTTVPTTTIPTTTIPTTTTQSYTACGQVEKVTAGQGITCGNFDAIVTTVYYSTGPHLELDIYYKPNDTLLTDVVISPDGFIVPPTSETLNYTLGGYKYAVSLYTNQTYVNSSAVQNSWAKFSIAETSTLNTVTTSNSVPAGALGIGKNQTSGPFTVSLVDLTQTNATLDTYYNGQLIAQRAFNAGGEIQYTTASGNTLTITVTQIQSGLYAYQKWAMVQLVSTIARYPPLNVTVSPFTQITYKNSNGYATAYIYSTASGGDGNYQYYWYNATTGHLLSENSTLVLKLRNTGYTSYYLGIADNSAGVQNVYSSDAHVNVFNSTTNSVTTTTIPSNTIPEQDATYIGQNTVIGPFTVSLTGVSQNSATVSIYYGNRLTNVSQIYNGSDKEFSVSGAPSLFVYIFQVSAGQWASIGLGTTNGPTTTISTTTTSTTTIPVATVSCPCPTKAMIAAILNDNVSQMENAHYTTGTGNIGIAANSIVAGSSALAASLKSEWNGSYANYVLVDETAGFQVYNSTNASGVYGYIVNGLERNYINPVFTNGTANSLTYSYLTVQSGSSTPGEAGLLVGYKNGYMIVFALYGNPNKTIASPQAMAEDFSQLFPSRGATPSVTTTVTSFWSWFNSGFHSIFR